MIPNLLGRLAAGLGLWLSIASATAQQVPDNGSRLAFVVGESAYQTTPLPTAANDAGLFASTLSQAGLQ